MTHDDWKTRTPEDEHAMLCGIDHTRPLADDDDDPDDPCDDPREVPEPDWDAIREAAEDFEQHIQQKED